MNTTAGPSIKNKRKNISNSLSGGKNPRSITRKTLTELQKKNSVKCSIRACLRWSIDCQVIETPIIVVAIGSKPHRPAYGSWSIRPNRK